VLLKKEKKEICQRKEGRIKKKFKKNLKKKGKRKKRKNDRNMHNIRINNSCAI